MATKTYKIIEEVRAIIEGADNPYRKLQRLRHVVTYSKPGGSVADQMIEAFASLETRHPLISERCWTYLKTCLVHPLSYATGYKTDCTWKYGGSWRHRKENHYSYIVSHFHGDYEKTLPKVSRRIEWAKKRYASIMEPDHHHLVGFFGGAFSNMVGMEFGKALEYSTILGCYRPSKASAREFAAACRKLDLLMADYHATISTAYGLPAKYYGHFVPLGEFQANAAKYEEDEQRQKTDGMFYGTGSRKGYYTVFRDMAITIDIDHIPANADTGAPAETIRRVNYWRTGGCFLSDESCLAVSPKGIDAIVQEIQRRADAMNEVVHHRDKGRNEKIDKFLPLIDSLRGRRFSSKSAFVSHLDTFQCFSWLSRRVATNIITRHMDSMLTGFRGNWLISLLKDHFTIKTVAVEKEMKRIQLDPIFMVDPAHRIGEIFLFYRRSIEGHVFDYCAVSTDTDQTYHAYSRSACLRGLMKKKANSVVESHATVASPRQRGKLTLAGVHKRYGFCKAGIGSFCDLNGLDASGAYTKAEIIAVINRKRQENLVRFGTELLTAGLV